MDCETCFARAIICGFALTMTSAASYKVVATVVPTAITLMKLAAIPISAIPSKIFWAQIRRFIRLPFNELEG